MSGLTIDHRNPAATWRARCAAVAALSLVLSPLAGCVRVLALGAKMIVGDPTVVSTFEQRSDIELQKGEHAVALVVDVPHHVRDRFDGLGDDLQRELSQRCARHGVKLFDADEVVRVLEDGGGRFSPEQIAKKLDVDCILHVEVESFTDSESGNESLLQSRTQGMVYGYVVRGEMDDPKRHVVAVYEEPFLSTYPAGHPLSADQTPRRTFLQRTVRSLADEIGRQFYDIPTSDLY